VGGLVFLLTRPKKGVAEIEVPDVTSKMLAEAKTTLEEAGFVVGDVKRKVEAKPADVVVGQDPGPHKPAAKGDTVNLVASDPALVLVPKLKGKPEDQATSMLAGLLDV